MQSISKYLQTVRVTSQNKVLGRYVKSVWSPSRHFFVDQSPAIGKNVDKESEDYKVSGWGKDS